MKIKTFSDGLLGSNEYLVWNESSGHGAVIDCGNAVSEIEKFVCENGITVEHIILTHGHFDHAEYTEEHQSAFPNATLLCHGNELSTIFDCKANLSVFFGNSKAYPEPFATFKNGDDVVIHGDYPENDIVFRVSDAPGHTPGGFLLICEKEKVMFTGDVLFKRGMGRTDFPGGDELAMRGTLHMIAEMDEDITFYPGHGEPSTVGAEKMWLMRV